MRPLAGLNDSDNSGSNQQCVEGVHERTQRPSSVTTPTDGGNLEWPTCSVAALGELR